MCIHFGSALIADSDKIKTDPTRSEQFQTVSDFLRAYTYGILQLPSDDILLQIFGKVHYFKSLNFCMSELITKKKKQQLVELLRKI